MASYGIFYAGYGAFDNGRVCHDGAFHFEGAYAIARTFDDIVGAAYVPVVAVFVAPGYVACIVDAVVPSFAGEFVVEVVFFEQSERFSLAGAYDYLPLLSVFYAASVFVDQVYVVLRIGYAHATRLGFHPRKGADGERCFCLAEAFHQLEACEAFEFVEYRGVQCFACDGAVFER